MKISNRNFEFESYDFKMMLNFLTNENSIKKEYFVWHIARLYDWKYNLHNPMKFFPTNFNDNTHLWFDNNELIGFILSEDFNNSFYIFIKDDYNYLYPEMINWYKNLCNGRFTSLFTMVTENEREYINVLESMGFIRSNHMEKTRVFDTSLYKDFIFEIKDIRFQNMKENKNYDEQTKLRQNVWSGNLNIELDKQIRDYCRKSSIYNPEFDFVLVDNNGMHIAGCEAFIDTKNCTSEIERVCTHSDYFNKGYSQNILKACMKRLYENNIKTAFIAGWDEKTNHLYGKL